MARDETGRPAAWVSRLGTWDFLVIVVLVVVLLALSASVEGFATSRFWGFLLLDVVPIALIALPMTLIVITGEIDLSVASVLGLSSAVMGQLWSLGMPLEFALPAALLLGAVLGAVNGLFVSRVRAALARGDDRHPGPLPRPGVRRARRPGGGRLPRLLDRPARSRRCPAPPCRGWRWWWPAWPWRSAWCCTPRRSAGVCTPSATTTRRPRSPASRWAGRRFWLFVVTGAVAALAGVFWTLRYASARADNGDGLELAVVAAVLLGGVSIFGGRGDLIGVLAGVLLLMSPAQRPATGRRTGRHVDRGHRRPTDRLGRRPQRRRHAPGAAAPAPSRSLVIPRIWIERTPGDDPYPFHPRTRGDLRGGARGAADERRVCQ